MSFEKISKQIIFIIFGNMDLYYKYSLELYLYVYYRNNSKPYLYLYYRYDFFRKNKETFLLFFQQYLNLYCRYDLNVYIYLYYKYSLKLP